MTITLQNNTQINLRGATAVQVIKVLNLEAGRLRAKSWRVVVWKSDLVKEVITEFELHQYQQARALQKLIIDMIIFTTTN